MKKILKLYRNTISFPVGILLFIGICLLNIICLGWKDLIKSFKGESLWDIIIQCKNQAYLLMFGGLDA